MQDGQQMIDVEALERQALACEEDNARLRAEIAAIEAELAQPRQQVVDDRPARGSRRLRDAEYTVAHLEATLSVTETSPDLDRLSNRDKFVVEAEALTRLAETVTGLETALAWTKARKLDAEALLERDRVYLNDAETMQAVFAERIEQAQAVEPPLPAPDGREIIRRTRLRLAELDRRFNLLQTGLRDLIDHVLVDKRADERFDPRWAEANQVEMQMRRRMATASTTTRDRVGGGTVKEDRGQESKKFDLRRYLRAADLDLDLAPPSPSSSRPSPNRARDVAHASEERVREFKLLLETLLNRSLETTSSASSSRALLASPDPAAVGATGSKVAAQVQVQDDGDDDDDGDPVVARTVSAPSPSPSPSPPLDGSDSKPPPPPRNCGTKLTKKKKKKSRNGDQEQEEEEEEEEGGGNYSDKSLSAGFFETAAAAIADELIDFVVAAGIAEEAEAEEEEEEEEEDEEEEGQVQRRGTRRGKKRRMIRLVPVGVRIDE